jgi:hypothetical protein
MSKIMFGIVMLLITMWTALPIRASKPANASTVAHPAAATMPTTAPTAPR